MAIRDNVGTTGRERILMPDHAQLRTDLAWPRNYLTYERDLFALRENLEFHERDLVAVRLPATEHAAEEAAADRSTFQSKVDTAVERGGLLDRLRIRIGSRETLRRLREREARTDEAHAAILSELDMVRYRMADLDQALAELAATLDTSSDLSADQQQARRRLAEAAQRSPELPTGVRTYTVEEFLDERPRRLSYRHSNGHPVLDGMDYGYRWRRDPEDDRRDQWNSPKGCWRVSRIESTGEIYAELTRQPSDWPGFEVVVLGTIPDHTAGHDFLTTMEKRLEERNSLAMLAYAINEHPTAEHQ